MSHIVTLCPPAHGHINPLATMPQLLDMEETVARTGLEYFPLGEKEFPRGWLPGFEARLGSLHRPAASRYTPGCCTRCRCDTAQCRAYTGPPRGSGDRRPVFLVRE